MRIPSALLLTLALAAAMVPDARAAELRWSGKPFQVLANEKRLVDFLRELAASQGTTAVIDPKIDGLISGKFVISGKSNASARQILDGVCASYGLTYYYDGALLFVEPASEARSEVLPISGSNAGRITDAISRMQLTDRRFPLTINAADNHVFVSGPRRYVDAVRQVVKSIDYRASQVDKAEVRLFPLKYAWAADFQIRRSGKEVGVPGVVSVLRSLFDPRGNVAGGPQNGAAGAGATAMPRVTGNRQLKLPSGATVNAPKVETGALPAAEDGEGLGGAPVVRHDLPQFHVDTRMNAVLVRDLPERMSRYAELIASMDMKPRLVEIEVTIMDISSDTLENLGVDWRLHGKHADFQTGNGTNAPLTWSNAATTAGQTGSTVPLGGVFTANLGSELRNFLLARVSALATQGQANFVARPKVLTLDNTEASLENKSEFYIKVPGFQDSSLYTVIAGTDVRVTPLVIDEPDGRGVMMTININDDSVTSESVDNVPIVRRRSVITQAMVGDGQGVLLAGYSSEERTNTMSGVPVLSKIPYVGGLFKYQSKKQSNLERFYLLTPRFVMPGVAMQQPLPAVPSPATPASPAAPFDPGSRS
ncbi:MAG: type III secretion system outer membrane ring subunit SctC [Rhizobacter sp.]